MNLLDEVDVELMISNFKGFLVKFVEMDELEILDEKWTINAKLKNPFGKILSKKNNFELVQNIEKYIKKLNIIYIKK